MNKTWSDKEKNLQSEKFGFVTYSNGEISEVDYEEMIAFMNKNKDSLTFQEKETLMDIYAILKAKQYIDELNDVESRALTSLILGLKTGNEKITYTDGKYKINAATKETGINLNSFPAKIPSSVANKMRKAVLDEFGEIDETATYDFEFVNIVIPYGKGKMGIAGKLPTTQWSGKVTEIKCIKKR